MHPLVSGAEAKRYEEPTTGIWLLFPYARDDGGRMRLIDETTLSERFPKAWRHLRRWERDLRGRERGKMDGDGWWGYNYPKNLDKQDRQKIVVPRLVEHLKAALDQHGAVYLDNVDVGGVIAAAGTDSGFLLGCLNGSVADFVFRAIAKPFRGDYRSANKQFIAPLPIPNTSPEDQADIAGRARRLQEGPTRRRDLLEACEARLGVLARGRHDERWLWPGLPRQADLVVAAPRSLSNRADRRAWADQRWNDALAERTQGLQSYLDIGEAMTPRFADGELRLLAAGVAVLGDIFLEDAHGRIVEAYWRYLLLSQAWRDADKLAAALRRPPADADTPAVAQFIERVGALGDEVARITAGEAGIEERLFELYGLSAEERVLVENDRPRRL